MSLRNCIQSLTAAIHHERSQTLHCKAKMPFVATSFDWQVTVVITSHYAKYHNYGMPIGIDSYQLMQNIQIWHQRKLPCLNLAECRPGERHDKCCCINSCVDDGARSPASGKLLTQPASVSHSAKVGSWEQFKLCCSGLPAFGA